MFPIGARWVIEKLIEYMSNDRVGMFHIKYCLYRLFSQRLVGTLSCAV
jgi:hypothetical protein